MNKDLKTLRKTDDDVVILPGAVVVGDVSLGPDCSIWYNAVLRGDTNEIVLGRGCNIQDNSVLHGDDVDGTYLGDYVSVGHSAIVHGCRIGDRTLIGMGAIILSGAVIGKDCIVGAGALVTGKSVIEDGMMVLGSPAKAVRKLTQKELDSLMETSMHYVEMKERYR